MEEIKEGIYYHYCSLETFINILKNKNIRLGNPDKMNDGNEIMLFFEKLKTKMNNHFELLKDEAVRKYYEYVYSEGLETVYNENYNQQKVPHIICLSKEEDLLSQWRGYADDGRGVAIGFDIAEFLKLGNFLNAVEVLYDEEKCDENVDNFLLNYGIYNSKPLEFDRMKDVYFEIANFTESLLTEAIGYKNSAFQEEKEVRLLNTEIDYSSSNFINGPNFKTDGRRIISYYELDIQEIKKLV